MHLSRLRRGEWTAIAGGILLGASLFVGWYHLANPNVTVDVHRGPATLSAWEVHPILRWLLLAAAIAPLVLGWIIAREHKLSWPRGQVTSVVAIAALGFLFWVGLVDRPGDVRSLVSLRFGWFAAVAGVLLMLVGSVMRQQETEIRRKPPGTI